MCEIAVVEDRASGGLKVWPRVIPAQRWAAVRGEGGEAVARGRGRRLGLGWRAVGEEKNEEENEWCVVV